MNPSAAPLSAWDLHRTYHLGGHDLPVLRGVNLEVQAGEKVFLCGQSGAGKTTLLYVLGGLERPDSGDVLVNGASLYEQEPKSSWARNVWSQLTLGAAIGGSGTAALSELMPGVRAPWAAGVAAGIGAVAAGRILADIYNPRARRRSLTRNKVMGFVFQHYFLLPELTALENVCLPAMIGSKKAEPRARELLDRVGLSARLDHLPTELSGGEQQRVAIARALINDPGILYADEPTGNLDASTGSGVIDMLLKVVDETKKTLVVVTHDQTLAKRGDRRLLLKEGKLVEE